MDTIFNLVITANKEPRISEGVHQATVPASSVFPYLAPPNPPLPDEQIARLGALVGRPAEAHHEHHNHSSVG